MLLLLSNRSGIRTAKVTSDISSVVNGTVLSLFPGRVICLECLVLGPNSDKDPARPGTGNYSAVQSKPGGQISVVSFVPAKLG